MQNPFIIIRFVFFSLMTYMTVLTIVFASWNVAATISSGLSAPGASVFLILNGCSLFAFIAAGLAELVSPNTRAANVAFECGWTAIFSLLQLGAAVGVTVNGPAIQCQPGTTWGVCASSYLLVPLSWLSSFAVIAYFLTLFGTTMAHMHAYPSIWWRTVYSVPWFVSPTSNETTIQPKLRSLSHSRMISASSNTSQDSFIVRYLRNPFSSKIDDVENNISEPILFPRGSNGLHPVPRQPRGSLPGWAQNATARRALDMPFARKDDTTVTENDMETIELAEPQPRIAQPRRGVDKPFATRVDGLTVPLAAYNDGTPLQVPHFDTRPLSPLQRKLTVSPVFSHKVKDQNVPIPLPKLSEWVRADSNHGQGAPRR